MWPRRASQYPPYWMAQHNSAGAVSGNHSPLLSPLHTLQLASHGGQCPQFSLCVVSVVTPWQPCSGLAAWPIEGLPSPQKLHLSSGALQVSERLVMRQPFRSYHQESVLTPSWNSCSRRRLSPFHSTHSALLHPKDLCVSLSWIWRGISPQKVGVGF